MPVAGRGGWGRKGSHFPPPSFMYVTPGGCCLCRRSDVDCVPVLQYNTVCINTGSCPTRMTVNEEKGVPSVVSFTKWSKRPVGASTSGCGTKFGEALMPAVDLAILI